jgi:hypothetical protein
MKIGFVKVLETLFTKTSCFVLSTEGVKDINTLKAT